MLNQDYLKTFIKYWISMLLFDLYHIIEHLPKVAGSLVDQNLMLNIDKDL